MAPQPTGSSTHGLPWAVAACAARRMPPTHSSDRVPTLMSRAEAIRTKSSTSPMEWACTDEKTGRQAGRQCHACWHHSATTALYPQDGPAADGTRSSPMVNEVVPAWAVNEAQHNGIGMRRGSASVHHPRQVAVCAGRLPPRNATSRHAGADRLPLVGSTGSGSAHHCRGCSCRQKHVRHDVLSV